MNAQNPDPTPKTKYSKNHPISWKRRLPYICLLPLAIWIQWLGSMRPDYVETIYSRSIYTVLIKVLSFSTAWIPFSVAECLLVLFAVWILWQAIHGITQLFKKKRNIRNLFTHCVVNVLTLTSLTYAINIFLCGLNSQRMPIADTMELDTSPASSSELKALCVDLITEANALREKIDEDENGVMRLKYSKSKTLSRAYLGSKKIANQYSFLSAGSCNPKAVGMSSLMKFFALRGIFTPFTGEPNVSLDLPPAAIPFVTAHEIAHQMGIARENEADYIAYLSCRAHPDIDYQYSGAIEMLKDLLPYMDGISLKELAPSLAPGIKRDLAFNSSFWREKTTSTKQKVRVKILRAHLKVHDTMLKLHGEPAGLKSYGMVVDLLIAERRLKKSASEERLAKVAPTSPLND